MPAHFPSDEHGLAYFDGTHLYEHADPQPGLSSRLEAAPSSTTAATRCAASCISSALFWLDKYHIDGLRVDAVASMLYLDYSRKEGEWIPNELRRPREPGRHRLPAPLQRGGLRNYPDVQTIAEESTAWPMVSRPTYLGGLGFGLKWDMGWMHDTLQYFRRDPIHGKYHHNELTFRMLYAFTENFVLPLSHDEVVHGKGSLLSKMPGDDWQKFANLRLLFGYMYGAAGQEAAVHGRRVRPGQRVEPRQPASTGTCCAYPPHAGVQRWVRDLNRLYREERPCTSSTASRGASSGWTANDAAASVLSFLRKRRRHETILVVCNFTPVPRQDYRVGVPHGGYWREMLNSDGAEYGGERRGQQRRCHGGREPWHGRPCSLKLTLPPLAAVFLKGP